MLLQNKKHLGRVAVYGGVLCAVAALAGYYFLGGRFALGVLMGGALSLANVYSIIMLVETIAGAALGEGPTPGTKAVSMVMHLMKLALIVGVIVLLVITRTGDLFGIITGFTIVLLAHAVAGFMKARDNLLEEAMKAEEDSRDA